MKLASQLLALAAAAMLSPSVFAQTAGNWLWRAGATSLMPSVSGGVLSAPSLPDSRVDVNEVTQVAGGITYMFTDNIAVDVPVAPPFTHSLTGAGALQGVGKVAQVDVLPMSVFAQYRFLDAHARFRPYVGLGATYAYFFNPQGSAALTGMTNPGGPATTLTVDSRFTLTPQLGFSLALGEQFSLEMAFTKSLLKTNTKLSTGQTSEISLDPSSLSVGLGFRF